MEKNTIVIYGAKRSGNHLLQSYLKSKGEECEFKHEASTAKELYDEKGKHLIILVRSPRDQLISNMYSMQNTWRNGYDVGHVNRPLEVHEPHEIAADHIARACQYLKAFTDDMIPLAAKYSFQFILYDTMVKKELNTNYIIRGSEYYKKTISNYSHITEMLDNTDLESYCLNIWRVFNLQQKVFYPELAN